MADVKDFCLQDEARDIAFKGEVIAHASSYVDGKDRWIDLTLYKTVGGNFVLQRVGRTRVDGESERHFVSVSEEARGVIETLKLRDDDGVWYLTHVAKSLLAVASQRDASFQEPELVD